MEHAVQKPLTLVRRDDLEPRCPHCGETTPEVYFKARGPGWFLFPRTVVYFCPHCLRVLGFAQSRMA